MRRGERNLFAVVVLFLDFFGCLLHDGQFAVTHGLSCDRSLEGRSVRRRVFLDRGARERESVCELVEWRRWYIRVERRQLTLWTVACDTAAAFFGGIARSTEREEREGEVER